MEIHERVSKLEVKIEELEHNQTITESHLKKVRDNINETNSLIQDLRIVVAELKVVSENQTQILRELKESRQSEKTKREDSAKWLIRTIGAVIITALLGLIM
jgi:peptidoglycan hydrolase CwlO-like protein